MEDSRILRKKKFKPILLNFGSVRFHMPRHFGFCYGVENAIEIAYRAIAENPDKKIFLLSEIIHNPVVNRDLIQRGVQFIMDSSGKEQIDWKMIQKHDTVIIPAFGTTLEIETKLKEVGVNTKVYNTTCPFVEKVWKVSNKLGNQGYTIIIHGKASHEETKATFSQSKKKSNALIIRNMKEARQLADIILEKIPVEKFYVLFNNKYSPGFNPKKHLQRIGVVNQTTMLAKETLAISAFLKKIIVKKYEKANSTDQFADTKNTLCYATNDNQKANYALLKVPADLVLVVGGYNSSNTSHIVELYREAFSTFFISSYKEIINNHLIQHFDIDKKQKVSTAHFLPTKTPATIHITAGASCPDKTIDEVLQRLLSFYPDTKPISEVISKLD